MSIQLLIRIYTSRLKAKSVGTLKVWLGLSLLGFVHTLSSSLPRQHHLCCQRAHRVVSDIEGISIFNINMYSCTA